MPYNEHDFFANYNSNEQHPVIAVNLDEYPRDGAPWIVVRYGGRTMVLTPTGQSDHMCVDAHAFVNGEDATTGVFGMTNGRRFKLGETDTTSHGWHSAGLIALLIGEQRSNI